MNANLSCGWLPAVLAALVLGSAAGSAAQPLPYPTTGSPEVVTPLPVAPSAELLAPAAPITYEQLLAPSAANTPPADTGAPPVVVEADAAAPGSETLAAPAVEPEPVYHWYQPTYWFGPAPWDSGFVLGLNGAGGTSESISFRTGGFIKREGDDYKFDSSLYYNKTESEGVEIQSNALLDVRYDWLFGDSPWTLFVMSQTFYDEFQVFDINLNANSGVGYRWINRDWTKLTTSVGTGVSREFGGVRDEWVQEASFGLNYELQFTET